MQIWWFFAEALNLINNFSIYFSILLGRCAILSFLILFLVTMLRQTILKKFTFLRGLIWAIFFISAQNPPKDVFSCKSFVFSCPLLYNTSGKCIKLHEKRYENANTHL